MIIYFIIIFIFVSCKNNQSIKISNSIDYYKKFINKSDQIAYNRPRVSNTKKDKNKSKYKVVCNKKHYSLEYYMKKNYNKSNCKIIKVTKKKYIKKNTKIKKTTKIKTRNYRVKSVSSNSFAYKYNNYEKRENNKWYKPIKNILNISSAFGYRRDPFTKKKKYHKGIDISVKKGTPVYSAMDGLVIFAGYSNGYGYRIIIKHNNSIKTTYSHLQKIKVKRNNKITGGSLIALSGNSGKRSTGPHLHFEVIVNGKYKNPLKYLNHVTY